MGESVVSTKNEQDYFDTLKRILRYQTPEQLRLNSEKDWGLGYVEALEAAYENVLAEAKAVTHRRRRPRVDQENQQ